MESKKKSIEKTISWMIIDNLVTIGIAYAFTRRMDISIGVAIISNTLEMLIYYLHERVWDKKK